MGLNNLATACWWHKHPNYHYYNPKDLTYDDEDDELEEFSEKSKKVREKDFELALPLYKNSLYCIQKYHVDTDQQKSSANISGVKTNENLEAYKNFNLFNLEKFLSSKDNTKEFFYTTDIIN